MGTPGVKFSVPKVTIVKVLKANKGKITHSAKALSCDYITLKKVIDKDPELIQLVSDLRNELDDILMDGSEDVLQIALSKANEDLTNALKATFYVLNNKGKPRGYLHPSAKESAAEGNLDEIRGAVKEARESSGDPAPGKSSMETVSPVLDQGQPREKGKVSPKLGADGDLDRFLSV